MYPSGVSFNVYELVDEANTGFPKKQMKSECLMQILYL